ncbi:MAG: YARHG domain-containing protein [Bacteroidales bacterium]|nr:YARHG domain-containing protein [Bacteroidales bacterium]
MKRLILISAFFALTFGNLSAQTLDGEWTDGDIVYYVKTEKGDTEFVFDGFRGDDQSFFIKKTAQNQFVVSRENESQMGWSVGKKGSKVEYITLTEKNGKKVSVMACYDLKKQLCYAVQKCNDDSDKFYVTSMQTMFKDLIGSSFVPFYDEYGGGNCLPVKEGEKVYILKTSPEGVTLYNSKKNDLFYEATTVFKTFKYKDSGQGWWRETSNVVLNVTFLKLFDTKQLRLMRNEIYTRHGWQFQSEELKNHFSQFSWYKPLGNNANIKLSDLEQFNANLIKAMEK